MGKLKGKKMKEAHRISCIRSYVYHAKYAVFEAVRSHLYTFLRHPPLCFFHTPLYDCSRRRVDRSAMPLPQHFRTIFPSFGFQRGLTFGNGSLLPEIAITQQEPKQCSRIQLYVEESNSLLKTRMIDDAFTVFASKLMHSG